jgi:membrane protein
MSLLWRAARDYTSHGGAVYAAAMSYYVLVSLFPLLLLGVAVLGLLVRDPAFHERIVSAIVAQFPPEVQLRDQIESVVAGLAGRSLTVVSVLGLLTAVWTASGVFGTLRRALNRAFDVPGAQSFVQGKLMDLLSVLGVLGLLLLSIAASSVLGLLRGRADAFLADGVATVTWAGVYLLVSFGLSFTTFLVVYRLVPQRRMGVAELWPGALLAALGFEGAKAGFGLYIANFGRYQEVYGALSGAVLFLFFVFVVANIVIFAAELTAELALDRARRTTTGVVATVG